MALHGLLYQVVLYSISSQALKVAVKRPLIVMLLPYFNYFTIPTVFNLTMASLFHYSLLLDKFSLAKKSI